MVLVLVASAFGIACLISYLLARPGGNFQILDHPNKRSLHNAPTPRTGGLGVWAGGLVGVAIALVLLRVQWELAYVAGAALVVGVVSFLDDRSHVPVKMRLTAHIVAGALLLAGDLRLQSLRLPGVEIPLQMLVGVPLSMLLVVWMTNLYNFMDGMDGFAGGMGLFGFGTLGLLGYLAGDVYFAALCWAIAAATGGFLVWNFPPARIFMGDVGASVLGLMAATLSLWGDKLGLFPLWTAILVFSPFIADATVTLFRRGIRKERIWEAHRSHYYQRLVQLGWGHRKTVLVEYVVMIGCGFTAIMLSKVSPVVQWLGLAAWAAAYVIVFSAIGRLESSGASSRRFTKRSGATSVTRK